VRGEDFPQAYMKPGLELTGMAMHRADAELLESILNPHAVI
jgi:hypothetical protein